MTPEPKSTEPARYVRFSGVQRFEHLLLLIAFLGLMLTGLPQKYAVQEWAKTLLHFLGGIESARILHRFFALLLMVEVILHVGAVGYRLFVLGKGASLLPRLRDGRDLVNWVRHNMGSKPERPAMPHYNFINKLDYWLTVIGTVILIITGYMLWNPVATTHLLPGDAVPTARVIHSEQALLMVILVVIWHGYNTLIRRFNGSIWTGKISRSAMVSDHGEALQQLENGTQAAVLSPEQIAQRRRLYVPMAVVITIVASVLLYAFVTFEKTAIPTIPRPEVAIFAPQIKAAEGDTNVGAVVWATVRCALCHGADAAGGQDGVPALRGTNLSFENFFQQVRSGSDKMPAFRAEELPDAYVLHLYTWLTTSSKP